MAWVIPVVGAIGSLVQGESGKQSADYNANMMRTEANLTSDQYAREEEAQRRQGAMMIGSQVAAAGQSGTGFGGSTEAVIRQSTINAELDAQNIRYQGQLRRFSYLEQANNDEQAGNNAETAGLFNAAGSVLRGSYNYGSGYSMKGAGTNVSGT